MRTKGTLTYDVLTEGKGGRPKSRLESDSARGKGVENPNCGHRLCMAPQSPLSPTEISVRRVPASPPPSLLD